MDVPSLMSDSPSIIMRSFFGAFNIFSKADTAIGSVDPRIDPITQSPAKEIEWKFRRYNNPAKPRVLNKTPGPASKRMGFRHFLNMKRSELYPLSKTRSGMNRK